MRTYYPHANGKNCAAQCTERWFPWLAIGTVLGVMIAALKLEGRRWWCACGEWSPWKSDVWSKHCSQHLADPYSLSHICHGLIFYSLLASLPWTARWSVRWRLCMAVAAAAVWEIAENSPFVVERYRAATMSLDYLGDSVANSVGDVLACALGFLAARRLGPWRTVAAFIARELISLAWIKDNLTLNVLMLTWPIDSVRAWQTAGHGAG